MPASESNFLKEFRRAIGRRCNLMEFVRKFSASEGLLDEIEVYERAFQASANPLVQHAFILKKDREQDRKLLDIFSNCGLDPNRPAHWRALVDAFVEVGFKPAGAKKKWSDEAYVDLYCDVQEIKSEHPEAGSDSEIARLLRTKKVFKDRYSKFKPDYLRHRVAEALARRDEFSVFEDRDRVAQMLAAESGRDVEFVNRILEEFLQGRANRKLWTPS